MANVSERQLIDKPRIVDLRTDDQYFFAANRSDVWAPLVRELILRRFSVYFAPGLQAYVVHDPSGSEGMDIIMRSLPKSRLLFLMRDARDVIDSILDSYRPGSWLDEVFGIGRDLGARDRLEVIETESYRWLTRTRVVQGAFDAHDPRLRHFVRYEELLADTHGELVQLMEWIGLAPADDLKERVARHSFASIPEVHTGPGKFHRVASPGHWKETWTAEEKRLCAAVLDRALQKYGYSPTGT